MHVRPLAASPLRERAKKLYVEIPPEPAKPAELVKLERQRTALRVGAAGVAALHLAPALLGNPWGSYTGMLGATVSSVFLAAAAGAAVEDKRPKGDWPIPVALFGTMAVSAALGVAACFYGNPVLWTLDLAVGVTGMVLGTRLLEQASDFDHSRLLSGYEKAHAAWELDAAKALEPRGAAGPREMGERDGAVMIGGVRLPKKSSS